MSNIQYQEIISKKFNRYQKFNFVVVTLCEINNRLQYVKLYLH